MTAREKEIVVDIFRKSFKDEYEDALENLPKGATYSQVAEYLEEQSPLWGWCIKQYDYQYPRPRRTRNVIGTKKRYIFSR